MGWDFTIGELEVNYSQDEFGEIWLHAKSVRLDTAPAFGEPNDYLNERSPSYTAWAQIVDHAEMWHLFNRDEEGSLITSHPGVEAITEYHRQEINNVYDSFKSKYPESEPNYESGKSEDATLCRLEWLKFWINWSLDNCKRPVFKNS